MKLKYLLLFIIQLFTLWLFNQVGFFIATWLGLPIPGNVIGMILLFILLMTGVIKIEWIDEASSFLLKHLVFFFIPITVGIMTLGTVFLKSGIPLFIILIGSASLGLIITGTVSQLLARGRKGAVKHEYRNNTI